MHSSLNGLSENLIILFVCLFVPKNSQVWQYRPNRRTKMIRIIQHAICVWWTMVVNLKVERKMNLLIFYWRLIINLESPFLFSLNLWNVVVNPELKPKGHIPCPLRTTTLVSCHDPLKLIPTATKVAIPVEMVYTITNQTILCHENCRWQNHYNSNVVLVSGLMTGPIHLSPKEGNIQTHLYDYNQFTGTNITALYQWYQSTTWYMDYSK